jgi:putative ABC transport system permease protein
LVSGVYPALYISRFQPITILKGKEKFGQRSTFSRILLTMQFMLAIITIVGAFVLIDNNIYLQSKDWGYDHEQNLVVPVNSYEQYLQVRDFVADEKNVLAAAGSTNHIGYWNPRSVVENRGERFEIVAYNVGFNYMETMNLRLVEGRFFDATIQSDQVESVIVNENFVSAMGWTKGVNQVFEYDSIKRVVIGVVKNFHYDEFYRGILPVMFTVDPVEKHRYLSLHVAAGKLNETEASMKEAWKKIAPDDPYKGIIQDDVFENMRHNNEAELKLLGFVAVVTVTLACLGLLGLVSYNITRRMKEFSVRKVFGASVSQIFKLMNRDYVWMLSIAFGLGAPVGYWFMNTLLESIYFEHEHTSLLPIVIAVVVMLVTVLGTVATQVKRILRENPADTLRSE